MKVPSWANPLGFVLDILEELVSPADPELVGQILDSTPSFGAYISSLVNTPGGGRIIVE